MRRILGFVFGLVLISLTLDQQVKAYVHFPVATVETGDNQEYTTVTQAVKKFEEKYGWKVEAPTVFPTTYTLQQGRVYDNDAKLELTYKHKSETLIVLVIAREESLRPTEYQEIVELQDGTKAYYRVRIPGFQQLDFRKGELVYKIWAS